MLLRFNFMFNLQITVLHCHGIVLEIITCALSVVSEWYWGNTLWPYALSLAYLAESWKDFNAEILFLVHSSLSKNLHWWVYSGSCVADDIKRLMFAGLVTGLFCWRLPKISSLSSLLSGCSFPCLCIILNISLRVSNSVPKNKALRKCFLKREPYYDWFRTEAIELRWLPKGIPHNPFLTLYDLNTFLICLRSR